MEYSGTLFTLTLYFFPTSFSPLFFNTFVPNTIPLSVPSSAVAHVYPITLSAWSKDYNRAIYNLRKKLDEAMKNPVR